MVVPASVVMWAESPAVPVSGCEFSLILSAGGDLRGGYS